MGEGYFREEGGEVRTASEGEKRETVERDGGEEKREGEGKVTGE